VVRGQGFWQRKEMGCFINLRKNMNLSNNSFIPPFMARNNLNDLMISFRLAAKIKLQIAQMLVFS